MEFSSVFNRLYVTTVSVSEYFTIWQLIQIHIWWLPNTIKKSKCAWNCALWLHAYKPIQVFSKTIHIQDWNWKIHCTGRTKPWRHLFASKISLSYKEDTPLLINPHRKILSLEELQSNQKNSDIRQKLEWHHWACFWWI